MDALNKDAAPTDERLDPPLSVKIYAGFYMLTVVVSYAVAPTDRPVLRFLSSAFWFLLFVLPIWRGSRPGWFFALVLSVLGLILELLPSFGTGEVKTPVIEPFAVVVSLLTIGLLVYPQTQRWCKVRL